MCSFISKREIISELVQILYLKGEQYVHQSLIRISHHSYLPVLEVERGVIHILSVFSQNLDTSNSPASVQQELVLDFPCVLFVMPREQREQTFCKTGEGS